jgi:hypothetical protein
VSELDEMDAASIGHDMHVMAGTLKDRLQKTALAWGSFTKELSELEMLHYELYVLCQRFFALEAGRGAGDRGE